MTMKTLSSIILILLGCLCIAAPAQAQKKFFEHGENGLTVTGMYKSTSDYVFAGSKHGYGVIADWSTKGIVGLGLEAVWIEHHNEYYEFNTESSNPDLTPFVSIQLAPQMPNAGIDLVMSYTFSRAVTRVLERPYDLDYESESSGNIALIVAEYYSKHNLGSSTQIIPLLRIGAQRISAKGSTNEGWSYDKTNSGFYGGIEISLLFKKKTFLTVSAAMFRDNGNWEGVSQLKAGLNIF